MDVVFGNQTITLQGACVKLGQIAENFHAIDNDFSEKKLTDYKTDYIVLSVVPSLDTGVCDYQTKTFNESLSEFKKVTVLTISNDLPFAQKRWCANSGLKNVVTLSDHKYLDFAMKYGTLLEPPRLQTRAVFVLDKDRKIVYKEYVDNVSDHPSYEEVTKLLTELIKA